MQFKVMHAAGILLLLAANAAEAFSAFSSAFAPHPAHGSPTSISLRSSRSTSVSAVRMTDELTDTRNTLGRKQAVAVLVLGALLPWQPAQAEEKPASEEKVCDKMMGCEQPKKLAPPKKVYKDIFEEERELARLRDEAAEKERKEKLAGEFKAVHGQFAAIQKGKNDLERDIKEFLAKIKAGEEQSWDDVRRVARLYDTALRKDGMDPTMGRIKKLKLDFDRKQGDELAKKVNNALKNVDKAGKKKDVDATTAALQEALEALQGWLALEPKTE